MREGGFVGDNMLDNHYVDIGYSVFHHYCLTLIHVDPIVYIRSLIPLDSSLLRLYVWISFIDILPRLPLRHNM